MKKFLLLILLLIFAGCDEINKYVTIIGTTDIYVLNHQFENDNDYYSWTRISLPNGSGFGWNRMKEGWQTPPMRPNFTGGDEFYIACDSEYYSFDMHQALVSPVIDCSIYPPATYQLDFDMNFQSAGLGESAAVKVWDGFGWVFLDYWDVSSDPVGEHKNYDVTAYADGNPYFQVGFEYDSNLQIALYFQIDNVRVKLTINN